MNIRFSILFISLVLASEAYAQAEQTPETLVDEEPVAEEVTQPDPEPEETPEGDLWISCTMPSLEVGTVGGGTSLALRN